MAKSSKKNSERGRGLPSSAQSAGLGDSKTISVRALVQERLKAQRRAQGLTLDQLADAVKRLSDGEVVVSAAHLSRIENGHSEPSASELVWLNQVLDYPLGRILEDEGDNVLPWFIVRGTKAEEWLQDVVNGIRSFSREDEAHQELIKEQQIYRYVPLEASAGPGFVERADQTGVLKPQMRAYLFRVEPADYQLVAGALDRHDGEEFIYCLDGELEFWCKAGRNKPESHTLRSGDCLHFRSRLPHGFRALGTRAAKAIFVWTTRPDEEKQPMELIKTIGSSGGSR